MSLIFSELLTQARKKVNQSPEGIAIFLNISPKDYLEFENSKIPNDEVLEKICELFGWNYNEIQKGIKAQKRQQTAIPQTTKKNTGITAKSSSTNSSKKEENTFAEVLISARKKVNQTAEGVALLIGVSSKEYDLLEKGKIPSDEILKKICFIFDWNYNKILQQIRVRSVKASLTSNSDDISFGIDHAIKSSNLHPNEFPDNFQKLLISAREHTGQMPEGIALILDMELNEYLSYEQGHIPREGILQKISSIFGWNYNELKTFLKRQSFAGVTIDTTPATETYSKEQQTIKNLCQRIQKQTLSLKEKNLELIKVQLELIANSLDRL
ncbi:MAG: transcriptional regulator with XRE-family HTH domain [bacterium]|jgi:transcriptional regulator with XRE-family HTH domain